jgi:hypothetical protein
MRLFLRAVVTACALAAVPGLHAQQKAQILLPMFDAQGAPLATFNPADLEIFEDGKPLTIVAVEPRDSSMSVTLALDNGRMMADTLVHVRAAAKEFFLALPPGVDAALVTTAPQPRFVVRATTNREVLIKAVDRIAPDSGGGRTVEALQDVAASWKKLDANVRPVLVVLGSTYSPELVRKNHLEEALETTKASRATVHAVIIKPAGANEGDAQLETTELFSQATRGRHEVIGSYLQFSILTDIAKDIGKNVSRQFLLTLERPAGAPPKLGALSLSPSNGIMPGRITRVP